MRRKEKEKTLEKVRPLEALETIGELKVECLKVLSPPEHRTRGKPP